MTWRSGRSYSTDLRSRVLAAIDAGSAAKAVAVRFHVSISYIYKALGRRRATGETDARPQRNRQPLKLARYHEAIAAEVARRPDATLDELRAWLLAVHQVTASLGLMHNTLARLGLTLKKSRGGHRNRTGPEPALRPAKPDRGVAERRQAWRAEQGAMSPERLVFVDSLPSGRRSRTRGRPEPRPT
jgi:transposase